MHDQDEDISTDNFNSDSEPELENICNMISLVPIKYDTITEVTKEEEDELAEEMSNHKPLCYYVMEYGLVEEEKAIFELPDISMQQHLKSLFI